MLETSSKTSTLSGFKGARRLKWCQTLRPFKSEITKLNKKNKKITFTASFQSLCVNLHRRDEPTNKKGASQNAMSFFFKPKK